MLRFSGLSRPRVTRAVSPPVAILPDAPQTLVSALALFHVANSPALRIGFAMCGFWPLVKEILCRLYRHLNEARVHRASRLLESTSRPTSSDDGARVVEVVFSDVTEGAFHEAKCKIVDLIQRYKATQQRGTPFVPPIFYVRILFMQHMLTSALNEIDLLNGINELLAELPHASNPVMKFAIVIARAEGHLYNHRVNEFKTCLDEAGELFRFIELHYQENVVSFCRAPYNSCKAAEALHDNKPHEALQIANAVAAALTSQSMAYITALIDVALCCMMCGPEAARQALGALSDAMNRIKTAFGKSNSDARRLLEARVGMLTDLFGFYVCYPEGKRRRVLIESYATHLALYKSVVKNACCHSNSEWVFFCLHHWFMCAELGEPLPEGPGATLHPTFISCRASHLAASVETTTPWMPCMSKWIMFRLISPRPIDPLLLSCMMTSDQSAHLRQIPAKLPPSVPPSMPPTPPRRAEATSLLQAPASSSSLVSLLSRGASGDNLTDNTAARRSPQPPLNGHPPRRCMLVCQQPSEHGSKENLPDVTPTTGTPMAVNIETTGEPDRATRVYGPGIRFLLPPQQWPSPSV